MRMPSKFLLVALGLTGLSVAWGAEDVSQPESVAACSTTSMIVRLPPSLSPPNQPLAHKSLYKAMPTGWQYGNWKMTYSSQPAYLPVLNLQWDSSPLFPQSDVLPGQNNDLDSYQLENSTVVITAYGVDTPRRSNDKSLGAEWDDVYDYVGKGNISPDNNTFEIISWGYDTDGVPYAVIYETPVAATDATAGLDIESRSDTGPSETTLQAIKDALLSLGNEQITELVNQSVPLVQNGARKGSAPVVCDAFCVDNSDL